MGRLRIYGVGRFRRWLRRLRGGSIILAYHRIAEVASDPHLLCVTPAHFAEHLEYLRQCYYPMSLQELYRRLMEGRVPRRGVAITFDDGYADNLWNAKPLLERYDIPATVFIISGKVGDYREFWWDRLERLLLLPRILPPRLTLSLNGQIYTWATATPEERKATYYAVHWLLRPLSVEVREQALAQIHQWASDPEDERETHRPLSPEEVVALADGGLIEIGAHTVTHPVLAVQPIEMQRWEIEQSKRDLEVILGHPVRSFSYPYGEQADVDEVTRQIVKTAGFSLACASVLDVVRKHTDPYWMPRFTVWDWDGDQFARLLYI